MTSYKAGLGQYHLLKARWYSTEGRFDVLVVVETWHDCSQSVVLRRIAPPGYQLIDAARPIPADVSANTVDRYGILGFNVPLDTV